MDFYSFSLAYSCATIKFIGEVDVAVAPVASNMCCHLTYPFLQTILKLLQLFYIIFHAIYIVYKRYTNT